MKSLLNCLASDFRNFNKEELFNSIKVSEGRTILAENAVSCTPVVPTIKNSEVARAAGADFILPNNFNVLDGVTMGLDSSGEPIIRLKELAGRPIGVNLEPVDEKVEMLEERLKLETGRQVNESTLERLNELGADFVCITGNPRTGVKNRTIIEAIKLVKKIFEGLIIAGKMHGQD